MKFLQSCVALQPVVEPEVGVRLQAMASPDAPPAAMATAEGSFLDFAASQRLSPALTDLALYAILQHPSAVAHQLPPPAAVDGVRAVCRHLRSLGVYGPTAYLASLYGSSELAQGFCRLCAVWGGVYMLGGRALALELGGMPERESPERESPEREGGAAEGPTARHVVAVRDADGRRIACKWLVLNGDSAVPTTTSAAAAAPAVPEFADAAVHSTTEPQSGISRCICVLDGPLLSVEGAHPDDQISMGILYPPCRRGDAADGAHTSTVFVLQEGHDASVCPQGKVLLHLSAQAVQGVSPEEQLRPVLDMLRRQQAATAEAARQAAAAAVPPPLPKPPPPPPEMADLRPLFQVRHTCCTLEPSRAPDATPTDEGPPDVDVLWGAFFHLPLRRCFPSASQGYMRRPPLANVLPCDDMRLGMDSDAHVERARALFEKICPGAPFLPSADDHTEGMDDAVEAGDGEDVGEGGTPGTAAPATAPSAADPDLAAMSVE